MMRIFSKISKDKKGQSVLELAMALPIFSIIMLYLFDMGNVLSAKIEVNVIARTVLRYGIIQGVKADGGNRNMEYAAPALAGGIFHASHQGKLNDPITQSSTNLRLTGRQEQIRASNSGKMPGRVYYCEKVRIYSNKLLGTHLWQTDSDGKVKVCAHYISSANHIEDKKVGE